MVLNVDFTDIFAVITEVDKALTESDKTHYKIAIANKEGLPCYGPSIPYPAIFERNDAFKEFLFTKLINGERAALYGCPSFRNKMVTVRKTHLERIEKDFGKK